MLNRTTLAGLALALAAPTLAWAQGPSLHGFADVSIKNDYITPRGLMVTSKGTTIQALDGLVLDFPQDPKGAVTDLSVVAGTWSDFNPGYDTKRNAESFNEFDWFIGANAKFGKDWNAGVQYVEFISPQKAFVTEKNVEFSLAFDDSSYLKAFSVHPYAKLFYNMSGGSTVVVGKTGGAYDIELGGAPSIDLHPVVLSVPTWVTVGPSDFWGGGGGVGVFSTGLKATLPLTGIPAAAGHWSVYGSYQYYDFINKQLVLAESLLNGKSNKDASLFSVGASLGF